MIAITNIVTVFIGPPGVGKGTQAKLLSDDFGLAHLSTGDMLRNEVDAGTEIGSAASEYMLKGELVPDEIIAGIVVAQIKQHSGIILDGFPRNFNQAKLLEYAIRESNLNIDLVVFFNTEFDNVRQRINQRRSCANCGAAYSSIKQPKQPNVCDNCSSELTAREDDTDEVVDVRLEIYQSQTAPLIEYYKRSGKLVEINASASIDEVYKKLKSVLSEVVK